VIAVDRLRRIAGRVVEQQLDVLEERQRWSLFPGQFDKIGSPRWKDEPDDGNAEAIFGSVQGEGGLGAMRGELTMAQLVTKHGVHQTLISAWKRQAVDGMAGVFSAKAEVAEAVREGELEKLHAKIGQLVVERDFLRKASGR
jgi:transposase